MFGETLESLRRSCPTVHCITNYVAANDCANMLYAIGANPVMADDINEVAEITAKSAALCINLGTLSGGKIPALILAGKTANEHGIPVVLDPVGAGSSEHRTQTALRLLNTVRFSVIRANISEIKALALGSVSRGVDAEQTDFMTLENTVQLARDFSEKTGAAIIISGETDVVSGYGKTFVIRSGSSVMRKVTGAGCMLSAVTAAFCAAGDDIIRSSAAAVCAVGLCGEIAFSRMSELDGNAGFRNYLIDAAYNLTHEQLEKGARYEIC